MTLHVVTCARAETLAARLVSELARDAQARDPFDTETVLVPHPALGHWLRGRVAEAVGICANWRFEHTASFVWQCLRAVQSTLPKRAAFEPRMTVWPLLDKLSRVADDATFAPLHAACGSDEAARFRLARSIARLFERYVFGRIEWFDADGFPDGVHGRWQQVLWNELLPTLPSVGARHPARVFVEAMHTARASGARPQGVPARVSFFGTPAIAPAQLDVLGALSTVADVHLYLLDPSRSFWLDALDAGTRERMLAERPELAMLLEDSVHPLLAAWGKSTRDGLALVANALEAWSGEDQRDAEADDAPPPGTPLLARLQHAIRTSAWQPGPAAVGAPGVCTDTSIQIHGCHGIVRQAEALHDALLGLFAALPDLAPHEVAVLTPNLEQHAPAIEAVFHHAPPERRIPVERAQRSPFEDPCTAALMALLRLPTGRASAAALLEIVAEPDAARMLGFDDDGAARLDAWVQAAGIRAGIDEVHVAAAELDTAGRHTLRTGLHRLMLSIALDADHDGLADLIACGDCEASDLSVLDRLAIVVDVLSEIGRIARRPHAVADWVALLARSIDRLVAEPRLLPGVDRVRMALEALRTAAATPCVQPAVSLEVTLAALADELAAALPPAAPVAAVTVASVDALRGVPFRVICVVGMDEDAYPRAQRTPDWDLMAAKPRPGDRIARLDDRGAFLDALLAARDAFVVTYASRDARTDESRAAALPVEELREHLAQAFGAGAWIDCQHPLSACAPRLFTVGAMPGSHAAERLTAARGFAMPRSARAARAFLDEDLCNRLPPRLTIHDAADGPEVVLPLSSLVTFLRHPVREFVRQRLRADSLRLGETAAEVDPVLPETRSMRMLVDAAVDRWLRMAPEARERERLVAWLARQPALPGGVVGRAAATTVAAMACALIERLEAHGADRAPQAFELPVRTATARVRVTGRLDGLREDAQALRTRRIDRIDGCDAIVGWCRHLLLCAVADDPAPTVLVGLDEQCRWEPVDDPLALLAPILDAYLHMQLQPLPLAPKTAWLALQARSATDQGKAYHGDGRYPGECDLWFRRVWRDARPTLDEAVDCTRPLLEQACALKG